MEITYSKEKAVDITILYLTGCPYHLPAVTLVKEVIARLGVDANIEEVEIRSPDEAAAQRLLGSPTIRVNGVDIDPHARQRTDYSFSCRVYSGGSGTPSAAMIAAALQQ